MGNGFAVEVECYAGYRGEQEPRRFRLGSRSVEVEEMLDRWQGTDYRYFKLQGNDGAIYILRHDEATDSWEMTLFDTGAHGRLSAS